jgi:protein-disulfide isomerase
LNEKRKRSQTRQRNIWLGIISLAAIAVVALLIAVNSGPVGEIRMAKPWSGYRLPQFDGRSECPIKVEEFSDFQCPYLRLFADEEDLPLSKSM